MSLHTVVASESEKTVNVRRGAEGNTDTATNEHRTARTYRHAHIMYTRHTSHDMYCKYRKSKKDSMINREPEFGDVEAERERRPPPCDTDSTVERDAV